MSQVARIVFKTLIGYKDFTECKDLARLTVQTAGLQEMDRTTVALLACKQLTYVRMKDRWPEAYDVGKTGGYRQVLCWFSLFAHICDSCPCDPAGSGLGHQPPVLPDRFRCGDRY
jgi:hypothetical protein